MNTCKKVLSSIHLIKPESRHPQDSNADMQVLVMLLVNGPLLFEIYVNKRNCASADIDVGKG